ncbi:unnamed protein product, partial [Phaeothamnion confervicola]
EVVRLLGEGAYGQVHECRCRDDRYGAAAGASVAVKRFLPPPDDEDAATRALTARARRRELALARRLRHPALVRVLAVVEPRRTAAASGATAEHGSEAFLVLERLPETLLELITRTSQLPTDAARPLCRQLLEALAYLHGQGVVHRDVKPENVLVDFAAGAVTGAAVATIPRLVICDLGTARLVGPPDGETAAADGFASDADAIADAGMGAAGGADGSAQQKELTHYIGSRWYRAPELLGGATAPGAYGRAVDVWAAACLLCEMLTGQPLFEGDDEAAVAAEVTAALGPPPPALAVRLRAAGLLPPP